MSPLFNSSDSMAQDFLRHASPVKNLRVHHQLSISHATCFANLFAAIATLHGDASRREKKTFTVDLAKRDICKIYDSVRCLSIIFEYLMLESGLANRQRTELLMMRDLVLEAMTDEAKLHTNLNNLVLGGSSAFLPRKFLPEHPLGWPMIERAVSVTSQMLSQLTYIEEPDYSKISEAQVHEFLQKKERTEIGHITEVVEKEILSEEWYEEPGMLEQRNEVKFEIADNILYDLLGETVEAISAVFAKKVARVKERDASKAFPDSLTSRKRDPVQPTIEDTRREDSSLHPRC